MTVDFTVDITHSSDVREIGACWESEADSSY